MSYYSSSAFFWRRFVSKTTPHQKIATATAATSTAVAAATATLFSSATIFAIFSIPEELYRGSDSWFENKVLCDNSAPNIRTSSPSSTSSLKSSSDNNGATTKRDKDGMDPTAGNDYYYGMFPKRQLFRPVLEYPLWNNDWDGLEPISTGDKEMDRTISRTIRKTGTTRHIILVRHGQYDETYKDDTKRVLTPLGIHQAHLTGKRLQEMMTSIAPSSSSASSIPSSSLSSSSSSTSSPCNIVRIHVSNMTRAKQTADIIANYLGNHVHRTAPNPMLNEGRPCHTIPSNSPVNAKLIEITDSQHARIENAYKQYFFRKQQGGTTNTNTSSNSNGSVSNTTSNLLSYFWPRSQSSSSTTTTTTTISSVNNNNSSNSNNDDDDEEEEEEKHEFEVIVCHANVIRYFLCRALQLPPEAWLRYCPFNCSLTYITIRPTGSVSCRMVGDIGHLPYNACTFSQHHGFNW